jgi:hypothetical protein
MLIELGKSRINSNKVLDRIYYAMPVEIWLSLAIIVAIADLIFNYGTTSIAITVAVGIILGIYLVQTNTIMSSIWTKFSRTIQIRQNVIPLFVVSTILGTILMVFTVVDSAHGLIITASGVTAFKGLLSGSVFTGAAVTTTGAGVVTGTTAVTSASSNTMQGFANGVILLIKVIFAIAFIFGLKNAYDKYTERAEMVEIVQAPAMLIFVVVAIDGMMNLIFGPA